MVLWICGYASAEGKQRVFLLFCEGEWSGCPFLRAECRELMIRFEGSKPVSKWLCSAVDSAVNGKTAMEDQCFLLCIK